jgi:hypothetical protein
MEVNGMYPVLLEHPDAEIRALASKMIGRVKDAYDGFLTLHDAWTADNIRRAPETFVKQARFVVQALHDGTRREEQDLYARLDSAFAALEL